MVIYCRRMCTNGIYLSIFPNYCYIYSGMFIHNISREGNNVDIEKWTLGGALIYGASAGIMLYIFLWLCELSYAWLWNI